MIYSFIHLFKTYYKFILIEFKKYFFPYYLYHLFIYKKTRTFSYYTAATSISVSNMSRTRSLSSNKQRSVHNNLMRDVRQITSKLHARQFPVSQYQPKLQSLLQGFVPWNTNIKRKVAHHRATSAAWQWIMHPLHWYKMRKSWRRDCSRGDTRLTWKIGRFGTPDAQSSPPKKFHFPSREEENTIVEFNF